MNKNVLIAFGGATLMALVVAMMMSALLKGGRAPAEKVAAEAVPPVQILIASAPVKIGEVLTEKNIKWKTMPPEAVFEGTITREGEQKAAEAANGRALRPFKLGEPIQKDAVIRDAGSFMAAILKPGMRAAAVRVTAETMAGGFINPGDYVDVIMTYSASVNVESDNKILKQQMEQIVNRNLDRYAAETILQNIRILGIDQRATKSEEDAAKVGKTVTLEVDDRQAEILALASRMGDLSLSLRGLGDDKVLAEDRATISDARLTRIQNEINREMEAAVGGSGSGRGYVRVYNGGEVTNLPAR